MKTKRLNEVNFPKELLTALEMVSGELTYSNGIGVFKIDRDVGKGEIRCNSIQPGLTAIDFDITCFRDIEIPIGSKSKETMQFIYCLEGSWKHQFDKEDSATSIGQFQTALAHSNTGLLSRILVTKEEPLKLNVIFVNKNDYFNKFNSEANPYGRKIQKLIKDIGAKPKHFHAGSYSLKIAEQLKLVYDSDHTTATSRLLSQKGRYYLILAKHIEQFYLQIDNNQNTSGLLRQELKKISDSSEEIKRHPEIQHSIKTLCFDYGISPAKLQEGFKFMFDRTVSDFVRNVRLDKAEHLIRTTDLTISEIVYTVGLTSRSYFCKIFKIKFHCTPKQYKLMNTAKELA